MLLEENRDFYRVWFEYLIRTPAYLRWADWMDRIRLGQNPPDYDEDDLFFIGYGDWFGNERPGDYPGGISFDGVYTRLGRQERIFTMLKKNAFSLSAELAFYGREKLEMGRKKLGRKKLGRSLTYQREEALLEQANRDTLERWETREREYSEGLNKYRYRSKPPGVNWGPKISATLKRRLNYYHLAEVCGVSRHEIIMDDYIFTFDLPFGHDFFSSAEREIDSFRYWKDGHANRDPRHFLSEEIAEARKVIAAVESGWFPAPPPPFKNCTTEKPPGKFP